MSDNGRLIYANDGSILGKCSSDDPGKQGTDYEFETLNAHKKISMTWLLNQVYNPSIANRRRNKKK